MERTCEKLVNFIYALHLRKLCRAFRFFVVPKTEAFQHSLLKTKTKGENIYKIQYTQEDDRKRGDHFHDLHNPGDGWTNTISLEDEVISVHFAKG